MATGAAAGPRGSIGNLLRQVYARIPADAVPDDVPSRELAVLGTLAFAQGLSQRDVAERLGINRTIMVRLIDRLEDAGYVTRTRNPANRRSYALSLTEAGRKALHEMRHAVSIRDQRITASLDLRERRRLDELLRRLLPEPEHPAVPGTEFVLAHAYLLLRRRGDALLADVGLKMRHYGPLFAIDQLGPCPQQDVADYLAITEPAAANVVDELVKAGLVMRGQDPRDRRRYALQLTELGRQRLKIARAVSQRLNADVEQTLGAAGIEELRTILTKLLPAQDGSRQSFAVRAEPCAGCVVMTTQALDIPGMPTGYAIHRQSLDDTEAILAVVHASDIATLGYADFASGDVIDVYNGSHTDPERDTWVVRDGSNTVCAWAFIASNYGGGTDEFDVYGNPGIDAGVRPALIDAVLARVAERAIDRGLSEVLATAYAVVGDDAWAAVLVDHGFTASRRFSRMTIEFDGPRPFPTAPAGVTVRVFDPASERDWSDWHRILVDSFAEHWGVAEMTLAAFRGRIDAEQDPNFAEWFFTDVDNVPVGICQSTGSFAEQNAGWIRNLGVLPAYRGRGIARFLLEHAFASFTARGRTSAGLGVDTQNETGALRLYESVGLHPAFQADAYQRTIAAADI